MRVVLEGVPDEAARSSFQPFETAEQVVGRQTALERLAAKKPIDWTGFHKAPYEEMSKGGGPRLHPSDLAEAELLGIDIRNMTAEEVFEAINTRSPKGPRLYEPHVRSPVLEPDMRFRPQDLNDDVGFVRPNGWVTQRMVVADDGRSIQVEPDRAKCDGDLGRVGVDDLTQQQLGPDRDDLGPRWIRQRCTRESIGPRRSGPDRAWTHRRSGSGPRG